MTDSSLPPVTVTSKVAPASARMRVYQPQCKVTLVKASRRTSLGNTSNDQGTAIAPAPRVGSIDTIDLTPFLSDQGGVQTQKSVRGPAGGFSLVLEDRPIYGDTLYGLIEPQDIIEIRMARVRAGVLPLVMRGLVSAVDRSISIEGNTPSRLVKVSGHDFGKVLEQLRIYYLPGSVVGEIWLDQFKFFRQYKTDAKIMQAGAFLDLVCNEVINPYIDKMLALVDGKGLAVALPKAFTPVSTVEGLVSPIGVAAFEGGSVYELLARFLDVGPFNELYVEDRETYVALVCRPAPWRNLAGDHIDPKALSDEVQLDDSDLIAMTASRSDAGVANYFWCSAGRWELQNNGTLQQLALQGNSNYIEFSYVNSDARLYGIRKMEVESQLGDPLQLSGDNVGADKESRERNALSSWLSKRRRLLAQANLDNVVLESGLMRLKGNETLRAGTYIELGRGASKSLMYATSVSHQFVPAAGFFTSVEYERGTGFVERQKSKASPWIAERNEGGAT